MLMAFNLVNRVAVLWNTRVVWPKCSQFLFNTIHEFAALVLRETTEFMLSREVVTQGDTLYNYAVVCHMHSCDSINIGPG